MSRHWVSTAFTTGIAISALAVCAPLTLSAPVEVDPFILVPASLNDPAGFFPGNALQLPYHTTWLRRVDDPNSPPADFDALVHSGSTLDSIDVGWFLAPEGADFKFPASATRIPTRSGGGTALPAVQIPGDAFHVAFYLASPGPGIENLYAYGWAKLQKGPGADLALLASALTGDQRGIVVGEYRAVPEPATLGIMALAGGVTLLLRRRGRR